MLDNLNIKTTRGNGIAGAIYAWILGMKEEKRPIFKPLDLVRGTHPSEGVDESWIDFEHVVKTYKEACALIATKIEMNEHVSLWKVPFDPKNKFYLRIGKYQGKDLFVIFPVSKLVGEQMDRIEKTATQELAAIA